MARLHANTVEISEEIFTIPFSTSTSVNSIGHQPVPTTIRQQQTTGISEAKTNMVEVSIGLGQKNQSLGG
jgi:hypothetical protein